MLERLRGSKTRLLTRSPTASKTSHRMLWVLCQIYGLMMMSLDISTAFLRGWTFEEAKQHGIHRQQCIFEPPEDVWELFAECDGGWIFRGKVAEDG